MKIYIKPSCEIIRMDAESKLMAASVGFNDEVGDKEQLSPMLPYEILEDDKENLSR